MSCCTNTYDLGCIYYCNQLRFAESSFSGSVTGVFSNPNHAVSQAITVQIGNPFMFDMYYLNENMNYTLKLYVNGVQIGVDIEGVEYDCFTVKTEIIGIAVDFVPLPNTQNATVILNGDGTAVYTDPLLIGKDVQLVITDNVVRKPDEWTFNTLTGTLTFVDGARDIGEIIQVTLL